MLDIKEPDLYNIKMRHSGTSFRKWSPCFPLVDHGGPFWLSKSFIPPRPEVDPLHISIGGLGLPLWVTRKFTCVPTS